MKREEALDEFRHFVEGVRWKFARTYVERHPHEYTHRDWTDPEDFDRAIRLIEGWGFDARFYRSRVRYLEVDGARYWHMGVAGSDDPRKRPGLMNRAWSDLSRYRENAQDLGYIGNELDELVLRWEEISRYAQGGQHGSGD